MMTSPLKQLRDRADRQEARAKELGLSRVSTRDFELSIWLGVREHAPYRYVDGNPIPTEYLTLTLPDPREHRLTRSVELDREQAAELIEQLTRFVES